MSKREHISSSVIRRLPRYYRFLGDLLKKNIVRISSAELSARMGLTASQIRQDLNCFGGFGQQGYGYNVEALHKEIGSILGVDRGFKTVIIGAGNLGRVLAGNMNFSDLGFDLIGVFDIDPALIDQKMGDFTVRHMDTLDAFCAEHHPQVGVLCIPRKAAHAVTERLLDLGIKSFWNFSHYDLGVEFPNIPVENVHLGDSLMTLCYRTKETLEDNT